MFFHIFRNTFITNSHIPGEIEINYKISKDLIEENDVDKIFKYLIDNHDEKSIIFYELNDRMLNPIIQKFCLHLGLEYESYEIMIQHFEFYKNSVIKVYEPDYKDDFKPIPKRMWSVTYQNIFWNYGLIPMEYWINHVFYDKYASFVYSIFLSNYIKEEKLIAELTQREFDYNKLNLPLKLFIDNPYNNLNFNDEFIIFYFNKRLMNHLRNIKFHLGYTATGIDEELLSEYNKELEKGAAPNYDNESVYKVLFN